MAPQFPGSTPIAPWGIGVHGRLQPELVGELAGLAEELGYSEFWFNVIGTEVDPVALFSHAYANTHTIGIGVGVIPLDIHPAETWTPRIVDQGFNSRRITIGVGAGAAPKNQLRLVDAAIEVIRDQLPHARVGVGASGPRMLELTARSADAVVLSMLSPEEVRSAVATIQASGRAPQIVPYVYYRVATGSGAEQLLLQEMIAHGVQVNPTSSGSRPRLLGSISDNAGDLAEQLDHCAYPASTRIILRPVVDWDNTDELRTTLRRLSPREIIKAPS